MNAKVAGKTAKEVLDNIALNSFVKKILASKNEIPKTMAKMVESDNYHKIVENGIDGKSYANNRIKTAMRSERYSTERFKQIAGLSDQDIEALNKLIDNISPSNIDETLEAMRKVKPDSEKLQKAIDISKRGIDNIGDFAFKVNPETVKWTMNPINYYANIPKAYFNHPDPSTAMTRKVTAVAGSISVISAISAISGMICSFYLFIRIINSFFHILLRLFNKIIYFSNNLKNI